MPDPSRFQDLKPSIKCYEGYRACSPEETISRAMTTLARLGITPSFLRQNRPRMAAIDIPVYTVQYIFSQNGKGLTEQLSKASGLMEYIERFSWGALGLGGVSLIRFMKENFKYDCFCAYNDIKGPKIPEDYFFLTFPDQYGADPQIRDTVLNLPQYWKYAYSLVSKQLVAYPWVWHLAREHSNGVSAGNSVEEAIVHSLCEVVERYSRVVTLTRRRPIPTIDPASADNPVLIKIIKQFQEAEFEVVIKDLSLGLGFPSVGVMILDRTNAHNHPYFHWRNPAFRVGTAPDAQQAALRCFTELVQTHRPRTPAVETIWHDWQRVGGVYTGYPPNMDARNYDTTFDLTFLREAPTTIGFADMPSFYDVDSRQELLMAVDRLAGYGYDVLIQDWTHPVLQVPVVQAIIPQMYLEHLDASPLFFVELLKMLHQMTVGDFTSALRGVRQVLTIPGVSKYIEDVYLRDLPFFCALVHEQWDTLLPMMEMRLSRDPVAFRWYQDRDLFILMAYLYLQMGRGQRASLFLDYLFDRFPQDGNTLISYAYAALTGRQFRSPLSLCDFDCGGCSSALRCLWKQVPLSSFWENQTGQAG